MGIHRTKTLKDRNACKTTKNDPWISILLQIVWGWMDAMPSLMNYWPVLPGLRRVWGYFNAYMWALGSITHMASTWLVTMVTLLRYVAVCHPLEAGRMTSVRMVQWETLICVVFSIVFYLPRCFEYGVMYDVTNDVYVRQKRDWASGDTYNLIYKVLLYYVFIYVIPLSTLIYCTHKLIRSLKHSREKKERMTSTSKRRASLKDKDMDFTKSLIIVVIIFIICQLFNPVRRFLYDYFLDPGHRKCPYFYHYFQLISGNALMLNSAVNFLCYFLSAPGFKRKFLAKCSFCACVKRRVRPETETMDMSESV